MTCSWGGGLEMSRHAYARSARVMQYRLRAPLLPVLRRLRAPQLCECLPLLQDCQHEACASKERREEAGILQQLRRTVAHKLGGSIRVLPYPGSGVDCARGHSSPGFCREKSVPEVMTLDAASSWDALPAQTHAQYTRHRCLHAHTRKCIQADEQAKQRLCSSHMQSFRCAGHNRPWGMKPSIPS